MEVNKISMKYFTQTLRRIWDLLKQPWWNSPEKIVHNYQPLSTFPAGIYLLKVNNSNTRTRCEICSKLTIKTPEPGVFIADSEHVSHLAPVFLLLTLNMQLSAPFPKKLHHRRLSYKNIHLGQCSHCIETSQLICYYQSFVFKTFLANVPISYLLKVTENIWFPGILRG